VMMLTGRDAIRPYDSWTEDEWALFLDAMRNRGRPVYLLDDGGLMAEFIEQEGARYRLTPIEELRVPLFYTRDRETGWLYRLEWDQGLSTFVVLGSLPPLPCKDLMRSTSERSIIQTG
jgi:hypothetical protein